LPRPAATTAFTLGSVLPRMKAAIDVEDLLKLVLLLVVVWFALEIVDTIFGLFFGLLGFLPQFIGLVIVVLIVLWLLDRI